MRPSASVDSTGGASSRRPASRPGRLFLPSLIGERTAYAQAMPSAWWSSTPSTGRSPGKWEMRPGGLAGTPDAEWELPLGPLAATDFSETLRPLHAQPRRPHDPRRAALTSAIADKQGNNHGVAAAHRFTGAMDGANTSRSISTSPTRSPFPGRFKTSASRQTAGDVSNAGFFDTAGNPVTLARIDNYYGFLGNQFKRVFDGVMAPTTAPTSTPPTGLALSTARRKASVEFVKGQYQKLFARVGAEDRAKLTLHRDMLNDLALRVQAVARPQVREAPYPPRAARPASRSRASS